MTCRTRPRPTTTWAQQGGTSTPLSNPAARALALWTRPYMVNAVTLPLIGRGAMAYGNAGGNATEGRGWVAALFRYGHWSRSPAGAGGPTYHMFSAGFPFHAIVDPALPVIPVIIRVSDIVQVTREAGATFGYLGFTVGGGYVGQDGLAAEAYRSVGFVNYGGGTWRTYFSGNLNVAALHALDTGRLITDICELTFEVDGAQKQIRYYIDGVLVDTYTPAIDNGAVALARDEAIYWTNKADAAVTLRFHHSLGLGALVEIEVLS